jgi:hypothetical protein
MLIMDILRKSIAVRTLLFLLRWLCSDSDRVHFASIRPGLNRSLAHRQVGWSCWLRSILSRAHLMYTAALN